MNQLPPEITETPKLSTELLKSFRATMPFLRFLNSPLKPSKGL